MDNIKKGDKVPEHWNLYRRSYSTPEKKFLNPDGSATSRVFRLRPKDEGELSVDVKELTTAQNAVKDRNEYLLFEISVADVRKVEVDAIHDPLDGNDAHALIIGLDIEDDVIPGILARRSKKVAV